MDEQLTFEFEQRPTIKGFPELRWTGKRPYRSTQYYPAQLRESYGKEQNGWINKIFWGDNLQVMSHLLKDYRGQVDLIYVRRAAAITRGTRDSLTARPKLAAKSGRLSASPFCSALWIRFRLAVFSPEKDMSSSCPATWARGRG